jgi:hypothetical protein
MTLSIELDAPSLAALNRQAADLGIRAEELAKRILNRQLCEPAIATDAAFREAMSATFEKHDELLRRLAK